MCEGFILHAFHLQSCDLGPNLGEGMLDSCGEHIFTKQFHRFIFASVLDGFGFKFTVNPNDIPTRVLFFEALRDSDLQVVNGNDLKTEMIRAAHESGNERAGYGGSACSKTPTLETPPTSLTKVEKALDSMMTPPPVGIQTVPCRFGFCVLICLIWVGKSMFDL